MLGYTVNAVVVFTILALVAVLLALHGLPPAAKLAVVGLAAVVTAFLVVAQAELRRRVGPALRRPLTTEDAAAHRAVLHRYRLLVVAVLVPAVAADAVLGAVGHATFVVAVSAAAMGVYLWPLGRLMGIRDYRPAAVVTAALGVVAAAGTALHPHSYSWSTKAAIAVAIVLWLAALRLLDALRHPPVV